MASATKREKASEHFLVRFTSKEKKTFEELAQKAGLSLSEYARQTIFAGSGKKKGPDICLLMELRHAAGICKSALEHNSDASISDAFATLQNVASKIAKRI